MDVQYTGGSHEYSGDITSSLGGGGGGGTPRNLMINVAEGHWENNGAFRK